MTIQTGIAVALALVVVVSFFLFPSYWPFQLATPSGALATDASPEGGAQPAPAGGGEPVTELQVIDAVVGTGEAVVAGDEISVHYVGALTDGTVFDASANRGGPAPFVIGVGRVIPGWDKGLIGMKEGGKRRLVIPAALAYGDNGIPGVIPGGATLLFEVELVKILSRGGQ